MFSTFDESMMREALLEAEKALARGDVPVGCVIVKNGEIVARAGNDRAMGPLGHAEVLAILQASKGGGRLSDCAIYVTLEPCPMCAGAIVNARLSRLVFGAFDKKAGCAGSVYRISEDPAFDHFCPSDGGLLANECETLLRRCFSR